MLTEQFLNLTTAVCLSGNKKFTTRVYKDLHEIYEYYNTKEETIPIHFKLKYELVKTVLKLKFEQHMDKESIVDNIKTVGKFTEFHESLEAASKLELDDIRIENALNNIKAKKKIIKILPDTDKLKKFIEKYEANNFTDADQLIMHYDLLIDDMFSSRMIQKNNETNLGIKSLDLYSDDYSEAINQIKLEHAGANRVASGYKQFDLYMNGGFEPNRIYMLGGASSDGKSAFMLNIIKNIMHRPHYREDGKKSLYFYFTLENLIHESLLRLYANCMDKTADKTIRENCIDECGSYFKHVQSNNNCIVAMRWFPPYVTCISDLAAYIDEVKLKYKSIGCEVKGIFVDYLDLLKSTKHFTADNNRLELGVITMELKLLAINNNAPVVTVTQLQRNAYDKSIASSLTQIGESIKKVENSDFVAILKATKDDKDENEEDDRNGVKIYKGNPDEGSLEITIGKNRSGPKDVKVYLRTNFSKYKIFDPDIVSPRIEFKSPPINPAAIL